MINNIILIAANELRRMFKSPLAWIILATVQFLIAIFFYWLLSLYLEPASVKNGLTKNVVSATYQFASIIMLLVTPFLTMNLITNERRLSTIKLLFSSPISITELVLGKYFGMSAFYTLMLIMISFMPASLLLGTQLDLGQIVSGLIGLLLLLSSFAAIGLFLSSLTKQPLTAAISTFGVLFLLWIINIAGSGSSETTKEILSYLSLLSHYNNLLNGKFNSADVLFYIFVSLFFILLSIWRLDAERTHG